jgi:hypothetical protein
MKNKNKNKNKKMFKIKNIQISTNKQLSLKKASQQLM